MLCNDEEDNDDDDDDKKVLGIASNILPQSDSNIEQPVKKDVFKNFDKVESEYDTLD